VPAGGDPAGAWADRPVPPGAPSFTAQLRAAAGAFDAEAARLANALVELDARRPG